LDYIYLIIVLLGVIGLGLIIFGLTRK
jgi:hypothetical protein